MKVTDTPLQGLKIIEPRKFADDRGYFFESYENQRYQEHNIPAFVQDNASRSKKNVLRGLHYQLEHPQGKLVGVTRGSVWDVAVDIRKSSPTFKMWFAVELNEINAKQLYIPPGFAHGFCVLSDEADFYYKCTDYYYPKGEQGIIWNDEAIKIDWPVKSPILSDKDKHYPGLDTISEDKLFD